MGNILGSSLKKKKKRQLIVFNSRVRPTGVAICDIKSLIQLRFVFFYLKERLHSKTSVPELRSISPLDKKKSKSLLLFSNVI